MITKLVKKTTKKVVVLIDEVDKSSNNQLFISFLAMLRNLYLNRMSDPTFHAVILAGVHDVKSLKLKRFVLLKAHNTRKVALDP